MPLQDGDIVVDRIIGVQVPDVSGQLVRGLQYRFTVRRHGPFYVEVPEEHFDINYTQQLILKYAADQVELLERFPSRG